MEKNLPRKLDREITKTRQRDIEAVGKIATGGNDY
jgi:hypothetical protein